MTPIQINEYKAQLLELLADTQANEDQSKSGQDIVQLDQQLIGRLSRMDAIQHQAVAKAQAARRGHLITRIHAALVRIEDDEFGYCSECGEDIPPKRLDLDPTVLTCVSCAQG